MRPRVGARPLAWLGGLLVLYLGGPIAAFVVRFVAAPARGFHVPGLVPALWLSLSSATFSLVLITVFGVPLAYVLARSKSRVAAVVALIVQIPLALPPLMSGIVLIYLVGPYTFLGRLFGQHLTNSRVGVVIAMTFVAAPFLVVAARAAFETLDQGLLDVAATLGHSDLSRFWRVAVPLARPGIRAGMVLAWLRAFGEYGAVVVLAYNPTSLPVYTYNQFSGVGLATTLAPTALAIGVAVLAVGLGRVSFARLRRAVRRVPATAPAALAPNPVGFDVDHRRGSFRLTVDHRASAQHLGVLGASGSGKSALLRCIAGLNGPGVGDVFYGDQLMNTVAVERRRVGYVAQGFALFPHLTVWQQLLFSTSATPELASYWLVQLQLEGLESRYPAQLSGGQRQRVALAQALCHSPHVLLLDEPFSALDSAVRLELRRVLRQLQRETGLATVLVTHDPEEAAFLSDQLLVLEHGRCVQRGFNRDVLARPASPDVARLLGISNRLSATVVSPVAIELDGVRLDVTPTDLAIATNVAWSIRPERVGVHLEKDRRDDAAASRWRRVRVLDVADVGSAVDLFVALTPTSELHARISGPTELHAGDECWIDLAPDDISLWALQSLGVDEAPMRTP